MEERLMKLKVLLPHGVFLEKEGVRRITSFSAGCSFGLLPMRLDCVTPIQPGLLLYESGDGSGSCIAVDRGILVKTGPDVTVSVRNAVAGVEPGGLREAVKREFLALDERERHFRELLAGVEAALMKRLMERENG